MVVDPLLLNLYPPDPCEAVEALRPLLDRIRRGEWRLVIMGPTSARERDEAGTFSARLLDLADACEGRR